MTDGLHWTSQGETLLLAGPLDRESLLPLWQQRDLLLRGKRVLDLSGLARVDSAGLALLTHLYQQQQDATEDFILVGASDRLRTLIALYNLTEILPLH